MSSLSKLKNSREKWKDKAVKRGEETHYLRKENNRVKSERDAFKKELKEVKKSLQI
jgi:predicted nuclease with TOPRIM domain